MYFPISFVKKSQESWNGQNTTNDLIHFRYTVYMPSFLIPALTALSGGLLLRDYKRRRLQSPEDRYMALYDHEDWGSNNMDMRVHFEPDLDEEVKASWIRRLTARLLLEESILSEVAEV